MDSTGGERKHYQSGNPRIRDLETANYRLVSNKGSDLSWRQFDLIHPVLYVELVNLITDPSNWGCILSCFRDFMKIPKIRCCSIPQVENSPKAATESSILDYWSRFEQESIAKSLEYRYISVTDIANCYRSTRTPSRGHFTARRYQNTIEGDTKHNCSAIKSTTFSRICSMAKLTEYLRVTLFQT